MRGEDTIDARSHCGSNCAALGRVESELVGLPANTLTRDATRRQRFVDHAASWLHTMVLHGRHCCCDSGRTNKIFCMCFILRSVLVMWAKYLFQDTVVDG